MGRSGYLTQKGEGKEKSWNSECFLLGDCGKSKSEYVFGMEVDISSAFEIYTRIYTGQWRQ